MLCKFVAHLAAEDLKHCTITKSYMAGIRHLHIKEGLGDPPSQAAVRSAWGEVLPGRVCNVLIFPSLHIS